MTYDQHYSEVSHVLYITEITVHYKMFRARRFQEKQKVIDYHRKKSVAGDLTPAQAQSPQSFKEKQNYQHENILTETFQEGQTL